MTEADWLSCTDPERMHWHVWRRLSERKARLLACALCRRLWHRFEGECSVGRTAIEAVERFADGLADEKELESVRVQLQMVERRVRQRLGIRDPLVPLRHLFSDRGVIWPAKAARQAVPKKERAAEFAAQAHLFRDVLGNPFQKVTIEPAWLTPTVVGLARTAYQERAFDILPVLGDALEDAGCEDGAILTHCRGRGPHVLGCWVLDRLLRLK